VRLIEKHLSLSTATKILDLACGKGVVSVNIAKSFHVHVYGFDLLPEFIAIARSKAKEWNVDALCHFSHADANEVVSAKQDYDCVIFGAAGNILGSPVETLTKLRNVIKPGGYVLIDEAFLPDGASNNDVRYRKYDYLTRREWRRLFNECGLLLVEEIIADKDGLCFDSDVEAIVARANELIADNPDKRAMFEGYIQSQCNEYADLENAVVGVTWMLQSVECC
jgi:ubiquinone/menaquinone biosynthesis C-methylase UbiE